MIKELQEKLKKSEVTSEQLVDACFDNIEKRNDKLNVFLETYKEESLAKAKQLDSEKEGISNSLLAGIPYALKDNICTKGKKTTSASRMLENYVAPYDGTVYKKIKKTGGVLLGKLNLDEFAMGSSSENSAFGVVKNPYDETRVAGGSSGGSAAAVASGMAVWTLGSDTGGSIRLPASFCGVVGLKPTYGRVSRYGLMPMASSYDQIGPLTKTVEDSAIVLDEIAGYDPKDNTTTRKKAPSFFENLNGDLKGKKIGILREFFSQGLNREVKKVVEERIEFAKGQGAEIVDIEIPILKHSLAVYYMMITSEVSSNLARLDGIRYGFHEPKVKKSKSKDILDVYKYSREQAFGSEVKRRIILGTYALSAGYYDAYYKKAAQVRQVIKKELNEVFKKVDVILTPTSPTPAFKIGAKTEDPLEMYLADIYTVTANVGAVPAISIPAGLVKVDDKELPVGLQLMGKWWDEQGLLNIAKGLEFKA